MSNGSWLRIPLWIPLLVIAFTHNKVHAQFSQEEQKTEYGDLSIQQRQDNFSASVTRPPEVTIIPPLGKTLAVKSGNPAHTGRVCSTWGNFHFKTFDGDIFQFPGLCNYIFASNCKASYEDFNIQIRRSIIENTTLISHISLKLDGVAIELTRNTTVVNGNPVQLPFSQSGILMQRSNMYLKISAKLGLEFMWNEEDALLVELHEKYANQTCGLCGDFNGISTYNEFVSNNIELTPLQFGNLQKLDGPTEQCEDPVPFETPANCTSEFNAICQAVLTGEAFVSCNELVNVQEYISSCIQDLCHCDDLMAESCMCNTFAEYSRQCAHAGGEPLNWRTAGLCTKSCPFNMQYQECGSPCPDTCTNPERSQLCEDHCTDACLCPPGTVYDDINNSGCIPLEQCYCTYKGETYAPGAKFTSTCTSCTCTEGQWVCVSLSCPGTCSIEGGSHISTFDEKRFTFFGDCNYVLTKLCDSNDFTVLGEIRKCGLTDTETCLKGVTISVGGGQNIIAIKSSGSVFVNTIYTQVPFSAANCTIFKPSSFYMIVHTNYGLQLKIQLVPIMQLYINVEPAHKGLTCGLCGNFNNIQADDFKAASGVIEGTSAAFANTWKTQADCPNVKNNFENPCTLSIENEQYAQHWCGLLIATTGPFAKCHSTVNPDAYYVNCMFDSCNCENSEDCMCAALSTYVKACATKGIQLIGWRAGVCTKYTTTCPKTLTYSYAVDSCEPTCRSLSEPDITCNIQFVPVDGCTCEKGTYMDESGKCVPPSSCPCYYKGSIVSSGEVVHDNGVVCSCTRGKLNCIGAKPAPACKSPMVYFNCTNTTAGVTGAECQKSCQTLDMGCYSTQCLSGCICPGNLVADGQGACIPAEECPCVHNENSYKPGETIKVGCNTCTCKNRQWQCTNESCLATCTVYGDGHYITFDSKRYSFSGDCEYTLVQNYCGMNNSSQGGTFRVITENIPCGTTGTTCSKSIKVFLRNYELILSDGNFEVIQRVPGGEMPFTIRSMGLYLVIDTDAGLIVMWDKKTSVFIKLSPNFKGQVCGLCGNFDGNGINDFTTRSQSVVGDVIEFGNSWKVSPSCPDTKGSKNPCTTNPYRASWAKKQCSIITSAAFANCHSQIEPNEYYEACVTDACACDTGGDCECFCTAVAAYAQKCNEAGICVSWRTPSICPVFCDYYNPKEECEWHYKSCGAPCIKTCRNKSGNCSHELRGLEGCYPNCPDDKPYFNEENMKCVETCGCYDNNGNYYPPGSKIPSKENCYSCECTLEGKINCKHDEHACNCTYDGKTYPYHAVIYNTTDGIGACILATCGPNGTINRTVYECPVTTTPFVFTSSTPITTTTVPSTIPLCVHEVCKWSQWYDVRYPDNGENDEDFDTFDNLRAEEPGDGDLETFHNIRAAGISICGQPADIECRAENFPNISIQNIGQVVQCDVSFGFVCKNEEQVGKFRICFNYQVRIMCCEEIPKCPSTTTIPQTTAVSTPSMSVITTRTTTLRACHCQVQESLYQPGEVIYNTTDSDGCVFYAICTSNCSVSRFQERCNTSTPATTTPATAILPTVTASTIITPPTGCQKVKPHRKNGETWNPSNCTIAKCENNTVVVENKYCPPAREITCANGYPPVLVTDETGCCHHYECQCTCSGWGDPHYITFDGTYYTFLQNCTYVLVKQIIPVYDNFRVYIDNYFCDAKAGLSCPKAIIIFYKSAKIVLTREAGSGAQANKIYFNGELVEPGLNQDGILIAMRGIQMIAEIPEIGAIVTFNGYVFSIQLPYSKFGNNTEGQCGTCTNNKSDECRLPDGQIISSCPKMAYHWKVSDNQTCLTPPPIITTPPPFSCEPSSPCKVILSKVFEECHKVIPPEPFYKGCVFDECRMRKPSILCSSLELYAFWCASRGVCIDWRNETNGTCPFTCPVGTVYKACGPLNPSTCNPRDIQLSGIGLTEGCFCPKGKTLLNSDSETCVPECICVGPGGESKAPGTTWESDCQDCICDNSTVEVHCEPRKCPQVSKVSCDKAGYIPVKIWTKDDKCCPSTECRCNVSFCPESIKTCEAGYESHIEMLEGSCCPVLRCRVPPGCLLNGTVYPPGMSWYLPGNNCTSYECKENNHHFFVVTRNKSCAALNPEDCGPEGVTLSADGCCKVCSTLPKGCKLLNTTTIISQSECTATVPIELTYCEGNCPASSIYSAEANMMEHKCKCCQEVKTSKKHVTLQCHNGTRIDYSYIHVDECGCVGSQCIPQSSHTTPAQESDDDD
ncbi:hypothetical protein Y1Q_0000773 [Alligator mississippiensis]|uniref:Mucin-5AC n=1 Tax=Alligator mississippiensis TaxID=8496 RepID=A0A151MCC7_ALLMI|nr:hypothetical protein Y1Q_0000773 [Alligator mississippiensis]